MSSALAALRAAADTLRAAAELTADDVAVGLTLCDEIAKLLDARRPTSRADAPPEPKRAATAAPKLKLDELPSELLSRMVAALASAEDVARVDCVSRAFHGEPPPPPRSVVEEGLRQRAEALGLRVPRAEELEAGEVIVQALLWGERRERLAHLPTIAAGCYHSAFVSAEGRLLTCGMDEDEDGDPAGLGHGEQQVVAVPTVVPGLAAVRVSSVAADGNHTLVLSEAGAVYSFGWGDAGRLGHGDEEDQRTPRVIEGLRGVRACAVAAGRGHSLVLAASGAVYSFGSGHHGQLGHGYGHHGQLTPKVIETLRSVRVCAVAAGDAYSFALGAGGDRAKPLRRRVADAQRAKP